MGEGTVTWDKVIAFILQILTTLKIRKPTAAEVIEAEKKKVDDEISRTDRSGRPE